MKLKTRLIIGFITVMILPLLLSLTVITVFGQFQIRSIERNYGISGADYTIITNPISALNKVTEPTIHQLSITTNRDAAQMEDLNYLDEINQELGMVNSYLLVKKNDKIVYQGQEMPQSMEEILPKHGEQESSSENGTYIGGDLQVLIKQVDFQCIQIQHFQN